MKRDNSKRARIGDMILRSHDGIGAWQIAQAMQITHYAVVKHIAALKLAGLPIDKTFQSGPMVLWCPADRVAAVLARQAAERTDTRAEQARLRKQAERRRYREKNPMPVRKTRPPTKADPATVRQRCVPAATAPKLRQRLGPASVFDLAGSL